MRARMQQHEDQRRQQQQHQQQQSESTIIMFNLCIRLPFTTSISYHIYIFKI